MVLIGAHVRGDDPVATAAELDAGCVQLFLADPQGWKKPVPRDDADALVASGLGIYAHAPYLVNVASTNNRIRIPSRNMIAQHAAAAAGLGARALIVHGGHVGDGDDLAVGIENWRKTFERATFPVKILVENTAGGENACARTLDGLAQALGRDRRVRRRAVPRHVPRVGGRGGPGDASSSACAPSRGGSTWCTPTARATPQGSARDRHAGFASGTIPPELIAHVVREAGSDAVVETPAESQAQDIAFLRAALAG